jgi:inorganic phosphate transporter, PiT family
MGWMMVLAAVAALVLAFANGSNDNAKGVATLIGSRLVSLNKAIVFAAVMTFLGSVAAIALAGELASRFGGKGIVDAALVGNMLFPISVGIGASLTVLMATVIGMPISTTHAMAGSIVGIGISSSALNWSAAASRFFIPLLISPLIAVALAAGAYLVFRTLRRRMGVTRQTCLCVGREYHPVSLTAEGAMMVRSTGVTLKAGEADACQQRYTGRFAGVDAQRTLDVAHLLSAGALSFGRGLNDTPKIAAVMIAAGVVGGSAGFGGVSGGMSGGISGGMSGWISGGMGSAGALIVTGLGIALGGVLAVRRVARTMSYGITEMNDGQAFTANFVTAGLVIFASRLGVPVSTTHVSCGSLFGIGLVNGRAHYGTIGKVLTAWVTTLPVAAVLAGLTWRLLGG